jgi:CRP/FNR family cyclic AMP-dependent transcriptional regulator
MAVALVGISVKAGVDLARNAGTEQGVVMSKQTSLVGAHTFLRKLPDNYVAQLAAVARQVSLPERHTLFEEGGTADRFWLIDAGQVALDVLVPGRGRELIEVLGRGDVVGLSWIQQPYQWRYGATTTQPVRATEFDARAIRAACAADPAFGYAVVTLFMAVAARRLQATRMRLLEARATAAR